MLVVLGIVSLGIFLFLDWKKDLGLNEEYKQADKYLDQAVTDLSELPEQIEKGFKEIEDRKLSLANCQFDLNQACLPKFQLKKDNQNLSLIAEKDQSYDEASIYALLYGDASGLMYYESRDVSNQDKKLGIDYITSSGLEFDNNPLVGAIFLKIINNVLGGLAPTFLFACFLIDVFLRFRDDFKGNWQSHFLSKVHRCNEIDPLDIPTLRMIVAPTNDFILSHLSSSQDIELRSLWLCASLL